MENGEYNQGPQERVSPDIMCIVEVICDSRLSFVWPVERRKRRCSGIGELAYPILAHLGSREVMEKEDLLTHNPAGPDSEVELPSWSGQPRSSASWLLM